MIYTDVASILDVPFVMFVVALAVCTWQVLVAVINSWWCIDWSNHVCRSICQNICFGYDHNCLWEHAGQVQFAVIWRAGVIWIVSGAVEFVQEQWVQCGEVSVCSIWHFCSVPEWGERVCVVSVSVSGCIRWFCIHQFFLFALHCALVAS